MTEFRVLVQKIDFHDPLDLMKGLFVVGMQHQEMSDDLQVEGFQEILVAHKLQKSIKI